MQCKYDAMQGKRSTTLWEVHSLSYIQRTVKLVAVVLVRLRVVGYAYVSM